MKEGWIYQHHLDRVGHDPHVGLQDVIVEGWDQHPPVLDVCPFNRSKPYPGHRQEGIRSRPEWRFASIDKGLEIRELWPSLSCRSYHASSCPGKEGASGRAQRRSGLAHPPQPPGLERSPSPGIPGDCRQQQCPVMEEFAWLERRWARPVYLAFVFFLTLGLLQAIKFYLRRQQLLRDLRAFPGPSPHWFTGNQKLLLEDNLEEFEEVVEKYPCAFPIWLGPFQAFFYICDPDYAKAFLSRTDPKSKYLYKFLIPLIGEGLLNLNGPMWFQHRRVITPVFNSNILKSYVNVMAQSVNIMLSKWEKMCGTQDTLVEVSGDISLMTLDTLMKCTFSRETNCQLNSSHDEYVNAITEGSKIIFKRFSTFLLHDDMIFKFTPAHRRLQKITNILHQYTELIIQGRRKSLKDKKEQGTTEKRKYQDFLDVMLSAQAKNGNSFSDTDLHSEVNTFMVAGQDTVGGSIAWLLYHLAKNPEHQERCREEIRGILGDGSSITWDQLGEMSYTTMCIKESLRLMPSIIGFSRELSKPITFPDGRSLPAGMTVVLSIWGLHRNPTVWENPKVFDPSRFSQENYSKRHSHSFLPFSAGPRNCIGQHFAMTELKVAIALILLRFKVALDLTRPPALSVQILLKPKNGIHLYLKKIS